MRPDRGAQGVPQLDHDASTACRPPSLFPRGREARIGSRTMISMLQPRTLLAEFVGTTLLVFVAMMTTSMAQVGFGGIAAGDLLIPAFGHACILTGLVYAIGHVSGCHINPAVTLSLASIGKFPLRQVPPYVIAQIAGGLFGALLHAWTWPMGPGTALTLPAAGVSAGQAFQLEAVLTFLLVSVVIGVAVSGKVPAARGGRRPRRHAGSLDPGRRHDHRRLDEPGAQLGPRHRDVEFRGALDLLAGTDRRRTRRGRRRRDHAQPTEQPRRRLASRREVGGRRPWPAPRYPRPRSR